MKIAIDKQGHFFAGLAISATAVAYGLPPMIAFTIGAGIGALKEVVDPMLGGQRDAGDLVATVIGAAGVLPLEFMEAGALPLAFAAQWWLF